MKKNVLLFSSLLMGATAATAQITITSADVVTPIQVVYQANDTLPSALLSVGSAGPSQTWNMTMLNTSTIDTMTFISYSWAPNANFPTSNLVMRQGAGANYGYLTNNASALTSEGFAGAVDLGIGPINITQINTPAEKIMTFPATYLTAFTNNFTQTVPTFFLGVDPGVGLTIDSIRQKSVRQKSVVIDAWGTLTTPLGTFNVIRSKETVIQHDTTDIMIYSTWNPFPGMPLITADSTVGYTWWANGVGFALASIKLDSAGGLAQVQWLKQLPVTGINEYTNAEEVNVYPNPAENEITFAVDVAKAMAIQVYDVAGRMIHSYSVSADKAAINVSDFTNGAYLYSILGKEGIVINRGKFTVAK
jgi:Secretion system C-terminal sorting domain